MSMTVSVRLKHKKYSEARGQRRHNERIGDQPSYVDMSRSELNSVLISAMPESQLRDLCAKKRLDSGQKKPHVDASILTDGIITFGTDAQKVIENLSAKDQDLYFKKTAEAIAEKLNTQLISLTVHRDESAIHAHFGLVAVNDQGRYLSKTLTPSATSQLQNLAGEVYQDLGIKRGVKKAERIKNGDDRSKIVHRSVKQLHEDLPRELEAKQRELDVLSVDFDQLEYRLQEEEERYKKNTSLFQKAKDDLEKILATGREKVDLLKKVEKRLEIYEHRVKDAESKLSDLLAQKLDVILKFATDYELLFAEKQRLEAVVKESPSPAVRDQLKLVTKLWTFATENSPKLSPHLYETSQQQKGQSMGW